MEPTSSQPFGGTTGSASNPYSASHSDTPSSGESQFSTTAAHATGSSPYPTDSAAPTASGVQGTLNDALASGKKWLNDSGIADKAQQLPKSAKELGNKALTSVSGLTTTQKAVGVGLLAAGVAFLLTRGGKDKSDDGDYRRRPRRSPFDHQHSTKDGDGYYDRKGQRPWGASRYGAGPGPSGKARVNSGSGYTSTPSTSHSADFGRPSSERSDSHGGGHRRDQGPATGSKYDSHKSGGQNPNNLDDLNSAF
ncbi:hypothetical protein GO988_08455 [Hymenobacter sp. HMF4947]|uniref:Uncharacterized protein n=1 Tax=Hymenobacter ginkgonis TaxID=2682976 RepID=A0A7K1TD88_9BACT|nr:hypothetical protein [Hymenobacter ginkgonis]MVN76353.1 hypothetical protein [Hymenobacter ginkgonis]